MVYGEFNDLAGRTTCDKIFPDKAFNIAKNPKCDGYQRGIASMVYKFFDKKSYGRVIKNEYMSNNKLAEELHKPIIRKVKERKARSSFTDNI